MTSSLLRRFIGALFLLWVISIIAFWLSKLTPGDAVMDYLSIDEPRYNINSDPLALRNAYQLIAHRRGLDLPLFYWSVTPSIFPSEVNLILPFDDREAVKHWIRETGNGELCLQLYNQLKEGMTSNCSATNHPMSSALICQGFNNAMKTEDLIVMYNNLRKLSDTLKNASAIDSAEVQLISSVLGNIEEINNSKQIASASFFPAIKWNGLHNQYHQWITGLFSLRPLTSLVDGLNAWRKIFDAMKWTLLLNGFAFILAICIGVLVGTWSGSYDGRPIEKIINWILFALFALPSFWLGTLFIYALTSGEWISVFPSGGLGAYQTADSWIGKWSILLSHLFLPVSCLALGALAYVSRQMKQSILHEYKQPYVKSLRAQGIAEKTILRKHVVRNAMFPIITIIGGSIPALLSGSLIIEVIYSIPGMGRLMYNSLLAQDWPVVFPILMLGAAITVFSYLLTDIVYKWADPRVKTV